MFLLMSLLSGLEVSAINAEQQKNPAGQWKFEAPDAPEGFTSGTMIVSLEGNKNAVSMVFNGTGYKFNGEKVKVENDSLFFSIYVEGDDVAVSLKMSDQTKMTGKAVYFQGSLPLTLIKQKSEAVKQP